MLMAPGAEQVIGERYKQLRGISREVNHRLMKFLDKHTLDEAAERMGVLVAGTVVADGEATMDMYANYTIHGVFSGELSLCQRVLAEECPYEAGSDERMMLEAMAGSRFMVLKAVRAVPGVGLEAEDLVRGGRLFLADVALSTNDLTGVGVLMQGMDMGEFWMSTGWGVGMAEAQAQAVVSAMKVYVEGCGGRDFDGLSPAARSDFMGACCKEFCATSGQKELMHEAATRGRIAEPVVREGPRVGRNEPCPCGSGKKYKKCCGG